MFHRKPDTTRLEKIKYVEEQATRLLEFRFESLGLLTKEALTTINWLFAVMIGSAGYALTEMKDDIWWLVIPLALTTILSAHEVWRLMEDTLQIKAVPSMGNEPTALTAEHILAQDEALIRQGNLLSMQTRINDIREINIAKGNAINRARKAIVVIPMIAIALAVFLVAIERVPAYLPYVCRLWAGV